MLFSFSLCSRITRPRHLHVKKMAARTGAVSFPRHCRCATVQPQTENALRSWLVSFLADAGTQREIQHAGSKPGIFNAQAAVVDANKVHRGPADADCFCKLGSAVSVDRANKYIRIERGARLALRGGVFCYLFGGGFIGWSLRGGRHQYYSPKYNKPNRIITQRNTRGKFYCIAYYIM